jgi:ABC-type transporter Mla subunit MlaD
MILALVLPSCELIEQPRGQFNARFEDAGGLRAGANVYVAGVRMGRVGIVRLDGDKARIDFTVDKEAGLVVREDACVSVGRYGQEPHLKLRPGTDGRPALPAGSEIKCVESADQRAEQAAKKATELLEGVASGKGTIGRLFRDEKLAEKVERFFEQGPPPASPAASESAVPAASASAGPTLAPPPKPPKPPKAAFDDVEY